MDRDLRSGIFENKMKNYIYIPYIVYNMNSFDLENFRCNRQYRWAFYLIISLFEYEGNDQGLLMSLY